MLFLALQGIRVLEIATGFTGLFCAKMLAEYEAEGIMVERPRWGDSSRHCHSLPQRERHIDQCAGKTPCPCI